MGLGDGKFYSTLIHLYAVSNTLATWCEELTHWKSPWCWKRLKAGGEGDIIGWDGWIASWTQWTWVWVSSRSWWWIGKPGLLQSMGLQRVGHNWVSGLNWGLLAWIVMLISYELLAKLNSRSILKKTKSSPLMYYVKWYIFALKSGYFHRLWREVKLVKSQQGI